MYDKFRVQYIGLFDFFFFLIGDLTGDMDIFRKIKEYIEEEIEINPYNLLFKNNSFVVVVKHRNMWPYTEYFLENIDYRRRGNIERLERFREEEEEPKIINAEQIFKSDECTICLSNPPNVLFCNCGHLCICKECDKTKRLKNCPICKTENTIKRIVD